MGKLLIINKIIEYKKFKSDAEFARFLDITPQNLSKWKQRNTYDIELLYTKCPELNPEWLLTGRGPMLKEDKTGIFSQNITGDSNIQAGNGSTVTNDSRERIKELQKQLIEKDKEIERQKKQIDKLFNLLN